MSAIVLPFRGFTKIDLLPDVVLEAALGELEDVLIIGKDTKGELYVASSNADLGQTLLRIEAAKKMLIENFLEG